MMSPAALGLPMDNDEDDGAAKDGEDDEENAKGSLLLPKDDWVIWSTKTVNKKKSILCMNLRN